MSQYSELPIRGDISNAYFIDDTTILASAITGSIIDPATAVGYILGSTDGGDTWDIRFELPYSLMFDVAFASGTTGVAVGVDMMAGAPVIVRTTDSGSTWDSVEAELDVMGLLAGVTFQTATEGVAVGVDLVEQAGVIVRTSDGGQSWERIHGGPDQRLDDVAFYDAAHGIVVGENGALATTSDGGASWVERDSGTTQNLLRATYRDSGQIVVVGGDDGQSLFLQSSDGGESWASQVIEESDGRLDGVSFSDPETGMAVGARGETYRTVDGGGVWTRLNRRIADAGFRAVSFVDSRVGTAVGVGGIIAKTVDGGNQWFRQESGTSLLLADVAFVDQHRGIAVGGDISEHIPVVVGTTDGGASWEDLTPTDLPSLAYLSIACSDADTCVISANCGMILGTEDGGASWNMQRSPDCTVQRNLNGISIDSSGSGTAVGSSTILTTADGGKNWVERFGPFDTDRPTDQVLRGVVQIDSNTATVVGGHQANNGTILRTSDGGENWTVQRNDLVSPLYAVDFVDELHGVTVDSGGGVYRTSDGGESWERQAMAGNLYGVALRDSVSATIVGYGQGGSIILNSEGGATFPLELTPGRAMICASDEGVEELQVRVAVDSVYGYEGVIALSTAGEPPWVDSVLEAATVDVPGNIQWSMAVDTGLAAGSHHIDLTGDDGASSQLATFRLDVIDPATVPDLVSPTDGQVDVPLTPTFSWEGLTEFDAYRVQIASDLMFDELIVDEEIVETVYSPDLKLDLNREYFWRVQGLNGCADSWSDAFSFLTEALPVAQVAPAVLELELPAGGNAETSLTIANSGIGDLEWSVKASAWPGGMGGQTDTRPAPAHAVSHNSPEGLDLVSLLGGGDAGAVLASGGGGETDCSTAPGLIVHDNGIVDNGYGADPALVSSVAFVDRFTPSAYPSLFTTVCVAFVTTGASSLELELVVFADDGADGGPGTELGAMAVIAKEIPAWPNDVPAWAEFDLSPLGIAIEAGSVYIGARWAPTDPGIFIGVDESLESPGGTAGGYWWNDGSGAWSALADDFENYRALFVRAVENPGGCYNPTEVSWLAVTPASGSTAEGGQSMLEVSVDATGLEPGEYRANLCIDSNDPEQPLIVVPVMVTVEEGGPMPDPIFRDRFE